MEQTALWWRDSRRAASCVAVLFVVGLCIAYALAGRGPVDPESADEVLGRSAVTSMQAGEDYYPAMAEALRSINGAPKSARDFREPLIFEVWHLFPSEDTIWLAFVLLAGVAGVAIAATSDAPLVAPFIVFYLLKTAQLDQHLLVEMWAGPVLVVAIGAWRHGWYRVAAAIATVAVLVRELAGLLLVGGLMAQRKDPRPWVVGLLVAIVGVAAHFAVAGSYVSKTGGSEAPLFGTGGVWRALDMAGVGFNDRSLAGLVLWPLAWLRVRNDHDLALFAGPLLALPLLGLFVGRDYWGFVVVPTILLFVLEFAWSLITRIRRTLHTTPENFATASPTGS